eukprot:745794-Pyramimonas_sp.AAC.1
MRIDVNWCSTVPQQQSQPRNPIEPQAVLRRCARFLRRLRFVVLDEAHVYRGVFGSHVALALRRLRRLCAGVYNSAPQFICSTATIANPK